MKVNVTPTAGGVLALVAVAAAGFVVWKGYKTGAEIAKGVKETAAKVTRAITLDTMLPDSAYADPAAQYSAAGALGETGGENAVAYTVNRIGGAIVTAPDGNGKNADGSWSLGGWFRDVTSSDDERIKAMLQGGTTNAATAAQQADIARVQAQYGGT